eukprot:scaffold223467_cov49-Prasinocladus_malaysianus.AAC.1
MTRLKPKDSSGEVINLSSVLLAAPPAGWRYAVRKATSDYRAISTVTMRAVDCLRHELGADWKQEVRDDRDRIKRRPGRNCGRPSAT